MNDAVSWNCAVVRPVSPVTVDAEPACSVVPATVVSK